LSKVLEGWLLEWSLPGRILSLPKVLEGW
jgi:hypothetical protein